MLAAIRHFVRLFIAITSTKFQLSMYTQLLASFPGPASFPSLATESWAGPGNETMYIVLTGRTLYQVHATIVDWEIFMLETIHLKISWCYIFAVRSAKFYQQLRDTIWMSAWSIPIVQVLLAVTLWLSGLVLDQTLTLGGVDVRPYFK